MADKKGKVYTFESENYFKTLQFGPGFHIEFKVKCKNFEENTRYRRIHGLDIYDGSVKVGECKRVGRTWHCYILMKEQYFVELENITETLNIMDELKFINNFIQKRNSDLPQINMITNKNNRSYYSWTFRNKGYFLKEQVHYEIKMMSRFINDYFLSKENKLESQ